MNKQEKHEQEVDRLAAAIKCYGYMKNIWELETIENSDIYQLWLAMDRKGMYYDDLYNNLEGLESIQGLYDYVEDYEV